LKKDNLKVAGRTLQSRLIVGTGKYKKTKESAKKTKSKVKIRTLWVRRRKKTK